MLNLEAISEMSYGLGRLVDEFRAKFENFHEFKCPEFDDFDDVDNFYSRLNDLRESNYLLSTNLLLDFDQYQRYNKL